MSKIIEADAKTWDEIISGKKKPVITMFYMETCPHCRQMKPVFEELAHKHGDQITFVRIDAVAHMDITNRYNLSAAPAFKFFKNGQLLNKEEKTFSTEQLNQAVADFAEGKM